jgi:hypothetical protein
MDESFLASGTLYEKNGNLFSINSFLEFDNGQSSFCCSGTAAATASDRHGTQLDLTNGGDAF